MSAQNVFFWWPDKDGNAPEPSTIHASMQRFVIDPESNDLDLPPGKVIFGKDVEFPRIDDRLAMRKHNVTFTCNTDPSLGTDFPYIMGAMGGGHPVYNSLAKFDIERGTCEVFFPGRRHLVQECIFIPRKESVEEADGYVMALVNNYEEMKSELVILDTKNFSQALALVKLPLSLRQGLHGNWVDSADADGHCAPMAN
jgi:carotenoid cleavage dioxygenase